MRVRRLGSPGRSKSERYPMQEMLDDLISKQTNTNRLMATFIVRKLNEQGVAGAGDKLDEIEAELERRQQAGDLDGIQTFTFEDDTDETRHIELEFSEEDIEAFGQDVEDAMSAAVETLTEELVEVMMTAVREEAPDAISRRAADIEAFQERLGERWKKPLDLLSLLIGLAAQYGDDRNDFLRNKATPENAALIECITRIQARAVQVAGEVEALLKSGFADGAMSRWRTLHELAVTAFFIHEHGNDTAQRYLDHLVIDSLRTARMYRAAAPKLGYAPMVESEWSELHADAAKLVAQYGEPFETEYGWASRALNNIKPNFSQIEAAVKFEKYRPYYKMASNNVHAGPRGMFSQLGRMSDTQDLLLSGPSNAGLEEAGRLTAYSVSQVCVVLLMIEPNTDANVWMQVIQRFSAEVEEAFIETKNKLEDDERRLNRLTPRKARKLRAPRQRRV